MTATVKPTRRPRKATTTTTPAAPPELRSPPPGDLVIGANVRLDPKLDAEFVDSIRRHGVLVPIVAYLDSEDRLVVLYGQRRTLAAVQTGRPSVPVVVVAAPDDPDRVTHQISENDRRAGLTAGERAAGFEQLAAFGLAADQIAKRTGHRPDEVERALTVARSPKVRAVAEQHPDMGFDQLAVVAEFEDDEKALAELEAAAKEGRGFAHTAQTLRDTRDQRRARAEVEEKLRAAGIKVVERFSDKGSGLRLDLIKGEQGEHGTMGVDEHAGCPGHAARVTEDWLYPGDDGYPDPSVDPDAEGGEVFTAVPEYGCLDVDKYGHTRRYNSGSSSGRTPAAEKTDEEREKAAAERREVIQGNKAWDSAQTVRRQWLTTLLARKTPPKGAAAFIAASIAGRDSAIAQQQVNGIDLARELLGLQPDSDSRHGIHYEAHVKRRQELTTMIEQASDGRATVIGLGLVLAAYEKAAARDSWRLSGTDYRGEPSETCRYLRYLASIGYELAPVERRACGEKVDLA